MSEPQVRLLREEDREESNAFHNRAFDAKRTLAQWEWEFVPSLFPKPILPFATTVADNRIVGTQALIPIRLVDRQGVYWTAKSEETLLAETYRGRGFSKAMYHLLFQLAEANGITHVWGFTTATSALAASGFVTPARASQLFLPFSSRCIPVLLSSEQTFARSASSPSRLKVALGTAACMAAQALSAARFSVMQRAGREALHSEAFELRTLEDAPEEGGTVSERFVNMWGGSTIYRDQAFLRWRIFSNPWIKATVRGAFMNGQLQGWVAYCLADDGMGYVVDVFAATESRLQHLTNPLLRALLSDAVVQTRNSGAVGIRAWSVNGHPFDRVVRGIAKSLGFYQIRRGMTMVVYTTSEGRQRGSSPPPSNWYVNRLWTEGLLG